MKVIQLNASITFAIYLIATICATTVATNEINERIELNGAAKKLKFGAKIESRNSLNGTVIEYPNQAAALQTHAHITTNSNNKNINNTTERKGKTRTSRRYDISLPPQTDQKTIIQYNIPIVHKDYAAALSHEPQRQHSHEPVAARMRNNTNQKVLLATKNAVVPLKSLSHQLAIDNAAFNNRSTNFNVNELYVSQQNARQVVGPTPMPVSRSKTRKNIIPTAQAIATTTVTRKQKPQQHEQQSSNPFEFLSQSVWNLFNPTNQASAPTPTTITTTKTSTATATLTRKPPKKYNPTAIPTIASQNNLKEEKQNFRKSKATTTTTTTTTTIRPTNNKRIAITNVEKTDEPFRIALPTLFNVEHDKEKRATAAATTAGLRQRFDCPRESEVRFQLFPKICKIDDDCAVWQRDELCCEIFGAKSCVSGIPKPLEETPHAPILGLIPRKCPTRPLAELWWDVQECHTDMDCWPRVCCPDGRRRYCRTSQPELETVPVQVKRSFNYLTEYLECTPPPPRIFDLHPKACTSTLDCFPNVCCQEAGLRHCRPPKKSLLTLMANFLNVDFVKRLTQNLVIKSQDSARK